MFKSLMYKARQSVKKQRGFTLLEVMAAVAIFAVSSAGLYSVNSQSIYVADRLETKTVAHWLAMNAMVELEIQSEKPEEGQSTDRVEMAKREWKISVEIMSTPLDSVDKAVILVYDEANAPGVAQARLVGFLGQDKIDTTGL